MDNMTQEINTYSVEGAGTKSTQGREASAVGRAGDNLADGIDTYSIEGLEAQLAELGQPRFRANQLFEWLYGHGATSYDNMTNLPASLRQELAKRAPLRVPRVADKRVSADGTRKYILQLADGSLVETVGIPSAPNKETGHERLTVCVSSQVGCAMGCTFCATGQEGFTRNLTPGEIVWQLLCVAKDFEKRESNVVVMGQGEPFLNYDNTLAALRIINHAKGPNVGARHITVSTCGILDGIRRFGSEPEQFTLAISLHAAQQDVRDKLMPQVASITLDELKAALLDYQRAAGRRISFEYLMIDGVNSGDEDLAALIDYCAQLSVHINLLPMNTVPGSTYNPCSEAYMQQWAERLGRAGIEASVRTSRGSDIYGACGQLKNMQG